MPKDTTERLFKELIDREAESLHLSSGLPPMVSLLGRLIPTNLKALNSQEIQELCLELMNPIKKEHFKEELSASFTISFKDGERFIISCFKQKGLISAILKRIPHILPEIEELNLPPIVKKIAEEKRNGLILISGPAGSGKSTTVAAIINLINSSRKCHILTLEDPIEYLHHHRNSIVSQREIGQDSLSFSQALREALRQDCDVIMVSEMKDLETIQTVLTAAETGRLVLATLQTTDCVQSINRMVDVFPSEQQQMIRSQLSMSLTAIFSQRLLLRREGKGRVPAVEVVLPSSGIRSLIREGKSAQIYSDIETGKDFGMQSFDRALESLYEKNLISSLDVLTRIARPKVMKEKPTVTGEPKLTYQDLGEETPSFEKKVICYQPAFGTEEKDKWATSSGVEIDERGINYIHESGIVDRVHISDLSILSKNKKTFLLPRHLIIKYRITHTQAKPAIESFIYFKIFYTPREKGQSYEKSLLRLPLFEDEQWHSITIELPHRYVGKEVKTYLIDIYNLYYSIQISEIIFF